MKLSVVKVDGAIHPIGEYSQGELKRMVAGKEYIANITMHRNVRFHRKAFALFNMLFANQDDYNNFDVFRKMLTMKGGRFTTVVHPNGTTEFWPESISFEKLPQDEFEKLFQSIITYAVKEYGHTEEMLWNILNYG